MEDAIAGGILLAGLYFAAGVLVISVIGYVGSVVWFNSLPDPKPPLAEEEHKKEFRSFMGM